MTVNQARAETVTAGLCGVLAVWDGGESSYGSLTLYFQYNMKVKKKIIV